MTENKNTERGEKRPGLGGSVRRKKYPKIVLKYEIWFLWGPQHPASFNTGSPRLSGNNLSSPGKKIIIQTQKTRRRIKRENPLVKSASSAPPILIQTSHFSSSEGLNLLPSGKCERKKSVVRRYSVKTNREEHRSASLQIFTPPFTPALSPPLSDRSG